MSGAIAIEITDLAAQHIRRLEAWWRINRTSAPNAVRQEVQRAFRLIAIQPRIGPRAHDVAIPDVRRIHLTRIRHHLYYHFLESPERIQILALWSESRGEPPPI